MPNCYQLSLKTSEPFKAERLNAIDEAICAHLGLPVHPTLWVNGWHNDIGFALATGKSFEQIIARYESEIANGKPEDNEYTETALKIAKFLNDNYVSDAFYESKR